MAILVDCNPENPSRFPFMMIASGGIDELAAFGRKLGLKAVWIQTGPYGFPHFRINGQKRSEAMCKGAQPASMKEIIEAIKRVA